MRLVTPAEFVQGYKARIGPYVVTKPYQLLERYADGTCLVEDPESARPPLGRQPALAGRRRRSR